MAAQAGGEERKGQEGCCLGGRGGEEERGGAGKGDDFADHLRWRYDPAGLRNEKREKTNSEAEMKGVRLETSEGGGDTREGLVDKCEGGGERREGEVETGKGGGERRDWQDAMRLREEKGASGEWRGVRTEHGGDEEEGLEGSGNSEVEGRRRGPRGDSVSGKEQRQEAEEEEHQRQHRDQKCCMQKHEHEQQDGGLVHSRDGAVRGRSQGGRDGAGVSMCVDHYSEPEVRR